MVAKAALIWTTVAAIIALILFFSYKIYTKYIARYFAGQNTILGGAARNAQSGNQTRPEMQNETAMQGMSSTRSRQSGPPYLFSGGAGSSADAPPPYEVDYHPRNVAPPTYDEAIKDPPVRD